MRPYERFMESVLDLLFYLAMLIPLAALYVGASWGIIALGGL